MNKTNFTAFQTRRNKLIFKLKLFIRKVGRKTIFFGIDIESSLAWEKHVDTIINKTSGNMFVFTRTL